MLLTRIISTAGAVVLGTVLVASTYGAQASDGRAPAHQTQVHLHAGHHRMVTPGPRLYGPSTKSLGMHCDSGSMAM